MGTIELKVNLNKKPKADFTPQALALAKISGIEAALDAYFVPSLYEQGPNYSITAAPGVDPMFVSISDTILLNGNGSGVHILFDDDIEALKDHLYGRGFSAEGT